MALKYEDIVSLKNYLVSGNWLQISTKELDLIIGRMFSISDYTRKMVKKALLDYGFMERKGDTDVWFIKLKDDDSNRIDNLNKQLVMEQERRDGIEQSL